MEQEEYHGHRERALQAFSTFLDAVQESRLSIFDRFEHRLKDIQSTSAREREESERERREAEEERRRTSERIQRLEETVEFLRNVVNAQPERDAMEQEDRMRVDVPNLPPNVNLAESARLREQNARLQDQVTRLQRENEDLRRLKDSRHPGPGGSNGGEFAVGQRNEVLASGSANPGKPQAIRLDTKPSNVLADGKPAEAASYPTPRSPAESPVPPPGPKDANAVKTLPPANQPAVATPIATEEALPRPALPPRHLIDGERKPELQVVKPEDSRREEGGSTRPNEEARRVTTDNIRERPAREAVKRGSQQNADVIDLTTDDEAPPRVATETRPVKVPDEDTFPDLAHNRFPPYQFAGGVTEHHKTFRFSRLNLANICGGPPQGTFSPVGEGDRKEKHGYDRFMCQDRTHNPFAPSRPGAHGSHFACRDSKQWPRIDGTTECLIMKEDNSIWGVYGLYKCERSEPLTGEEFKRLPKRIRTHWIDSAHKEKTSWNKPTLAAIHLRKRYGRDPSDEEIEKCVEEHTGKAGKLRLLAEVTKDQVRQAFENGEERLNVFPMQCVKFDTNLVNVIHEGLYGSKIGEADAVGNVKENREVQRKRKRSPSADSSNPTTSKRRAITRIARVSTTTTNRLNRISDDLEDNREEDVPDSEIEPEEDEEEESDYEPWNHRAAVPASSSQPRRSTRKIS